MGCTRYFPGLKASREILADVRKIIGASSVTVCGPKGQGLPIVNDAEGIRLNGFEAAGEAHETFRLQGTIEPPYPDMRSFCRTANKAYDVVVTAILVAAAAAVRSGGGGLLRSDGCWSSKINLTIVGPSGEINGETDRIRFNTFHPRSDFSEVTYFLTTTSRDDYYGYIRDGVHRYGIDADAAERWITSNEKESGSSSDYSLPSGTDTGLGVNYDLRYDGTKETHVTIVHVSPAA